MKPVLGIIGCGNMAYALFKGVTSDPEHPYSGFWVSDINDMRTELFVREFDAHAGSNAEVVSNSNIIILAVKPGVVMEVLKQTGKEWSDEKLLVSIAAGISTAAIEAAIKVKIPVVRVMPNTPCLVGEGAIALCAGKNTGAAHIEAVNHMLSRVGVTVTVAEGYMDAVTAVSGSGPAYAYLVAEAMIDAAVEAGLSMDVARKLVVHTIKGSMTMLQQTGENPAVLKAQVCSPGGTTIAGVRELEANGLRKAFFDAVEKACQRSRELGQN